jgi:hypothetical protein
VTDGHSDILEKRFSTKKRQTLFISFFLARAGIATTLPQLK